MKSLEDNVTDIERSNSLTDLAHRIKTEHEAIKASLRESVQHAFAAGQLLLEAKAHPDIKHGQWLPWLRDHCTISERTAQLYMRCAKNRAEIEKSAIGVADLTLTEAAAMLALSSDIKKLLQFAKDTQHVTDPEQFMQLCLDSGVAQYGGTIDYESSHTVEERREWDVFILYLVRNKRWAACDADNHVCWLKRHSYKHPSEWMDDDQWRRNIGMTKMPDKAKRRWKELLEETKDLTRAEIHEIIAKEDPHEITQQRLREKHQAIAREAEAEQAKRKAQ